MIRLPPSFASVMESMEGRKIERKIPLNTHKSFLNHGGLLSIHYFTFIPSIGMLSFKSYQFKAVYDVCLSIWFVFCISLLNQLGT